MMPSKHECAIDQIEDMYIKQCLENERLKKRIDDAIIYLENLPMIYQTENYVNGMKKLKGG